MLKAIMGSKKDVLGDFSEKSTFFYEAWWFSGLYLHVVIYRPRWRFVWGCKVYYGNWKKPVFEVKPSLQKSFAEVLVREFVDNLNPSDYVVGWFYKG